MYLVVVVVLVAVVVVVGGAHVCDGHCSDEGGRVLDGEVQGEHGDARGKHRDILGLEGEVCSGGALGPGEEEELLEEKYLLEELL